MAVQENTKTVTDHLNDVSMRIAQARGVVMSLMENVQRDEEAEGLACFGEMMGFTEVVNTFWAIDALLEQASDFCGEAPEHLVSGINHEPLALHFMRFGGKSLHLKRRPYMPITESRTYYSKQSTNVNY